VGAVSAHHFFTRSQLILQQIIKKSHFFQLIFFKKHKLGFLKKTLIPVYSHLFLYIPTYPFSLGFFKKDVVLYQRAERKMRHLKVEKLDIIPSQHYLNTLFDCLSKHLQSDTYDFNTVTDLQVV